MLLTYQMKRDAGRDVRAPPALTPVIASSATTGRSNANAAGITYAYRWRIGVAGS